MNIFIDTSILYKDPFWRGNFYKELLDIIKEKDINLYISELVLMELEKNYERMIDEQDVALRKVMGNVEHFQIAILEKPVIDKAESIKQLKNFYANLVSEKTARIVKFENSWLPEIVERAIWRKKPFSQTKTELKDAIIWLSYAKLAEMKKSKNCIFLTENISDFCDMDKAKNDIFEIHPELEKDSKRFAVYRSPKELIRSEKIKLQKVSIKFSKWFSEQNFDEQFVLNLISSRYSKDVETGIENFLDNSQLYNVFYDDFAPSGYLSLYDFEILSVDEIAVDTSADDCLVSGEIYSFCTVKGYAYNAVRDSGEEQHKFYGEREVNIKLTFSFYYNRDEIPRYFEIDDVEIVDEEY